MFDGLLNILLFLFILTVLVLLHELGHFVTARLAHVKVHEFGIGFPPRARILFTRGETTYTLNWLPIGGFVRLEGETVSPADGTESSEERAQREERERLAEEESLDPSAFVNQRLWKRLVILVSGSVVNLVLAFLIFTVIAFVAQPVYTVRLADVMPDSPAAQAGLVGGDTIVAIDGQSFPVFDDYARAASEGVEGFRIAPLQYLVDRPSQTVIVSVRHADGSVEDVEATLRTAAEIAAGDGALGFRPAAYDPEPTSNDLGEAVAIGLEQTVTTSTLVLKAVGNIVAGLLSGSGEALDDVSGPVGMVGAVGTLREGLPPVFLLWFVGLISANLGVINLLPIPPLDGSRMVMGVVQAASGNRVSPTAERLVYFTGWVALMLFLVVVTFNDVGRLFG